jgi:parallel beta-helix repeat protein
MKRTLLILICIVVLFSSITLVNAGGFYQPIPFHNSTYQTINDSNVFLGAYPEGIYRDMYAYFWLQTKNYTGDVDAVWGFNPAVAEPTIGELRINNKEYWNTTHQRTLINVSSNSSTSGDCYFGNDYNTFKRYVTYREGDENDEYYTTVSRVVCFDSYKVLDENNTVEFEYHTKHSRNKRWRDISEKFRIEYHNHSNISKWYLLKNVSVQQGEMYIVRAFIELKTNTTGKYVFAVKPSGMTIQEAIAAGYFYMLDPSWITWNKTGFDEGTYTNSSWNDTGEYVSLNFSNFTGNYTSKVFDATGTASWDNITWTEGVPYQEELPNNQTTENVLGGANMTANVLLFHFDNNSTYGENNTTFFDFSYSGNNGTCSGVNCPTFTTDGKFGAGAYDFDGADDGIVVSNSDSLAINETITLSAWTYPIDELTGASNQYRIIYKQYSYLFRFHNDRFFCYPYNLDGSFNSSYAVSQPSADEDMWWHAVCVIDTTLPENERTKLYINGTLVDTAPAPVAINVSTTNLEISQSGSFPFNGTIDEVAIWNRSLDAAEIMNLYKRGAERLNITVRSCDDSACAGDAWGDTYEHMPQDLTEANERYFQYRAMFETDYNIHTPELYNVTVNYTLLLADNDGDGFNNTIDCNDNDANVYPLINNTLNYFWKNTTICTDVYNNSRVTINASFVSVNFNDSTLIGFGAAGTTIEIPNKAYMSVGNATIYNYQQGIRADASDFITIRNMEIHNITGYGIYLEGGGVNDGIVANNTIYNTTLAGIYVFDNSFRNRVENNTFYNNSGGSISVRVSSHNTTIKGNVIYNNSGQVGIHFHTSNDGEISNNTISTNAFGIELYQSARTEITDNTVYDNSRGIYLQTTSPNNNITNNTVYNNSNYGIYVIDSIKNNISNNTIYDNTYDGIHNEDSSDSTISSNVIHSNRDYGIQIESSDRIDITHNVVYNNTDYGVMLSNTVRNSTVINNTVYNNTNSGIGIYSSNARNNNVTNNTIYNNSNYGVRLTSAGGNNLIANNTIHSNVLDGITFGTSSGSLIGDNIIYNNRRGVDFGSSGSRTIQNNTIYNNSDSGIYASGSSSNTITNNLIYR